MKFDRNKRGPYAFVCYGAENKEDVEYSYQCAKNAISELNGAQDIDGVRLPEDKKLYVGEAMNRS